MFKFHVFFTSDCGISPLAKEEGVCAHRSSFAMVKDLCRILVLNGLIKAGGIETKDGHNSMLFFENAISTTRRGYVKMHYLLPQVSRTCAALHSNRSVIWLGGPPGVGKTTITKRFQQYGFTTLECEDPWASHDRLESIRNASILAAQMQTSLVVAACYETFLSRAPATVVPILIFPTPKLYRERWKQRDPHDKQDHANRYAKSARVSNHTNVHVLHQYTRETVDETVRRICEMANGRVVTMRTV